MPLRCLIPLLLALLSPPTVAQVGGDDMLRGIVWAPPESGRQALADLRDMRAYGIEAIRMPLTDDSQLLGAVDGLGLEVFMDLPVEHLPASLLLDTLAFAREQLQTVVALRQRHRSIRGVGLASAVDTSEPEACAYFEQLADEARDAGLWTYYRTRFIEQDRCAEYVDAVLIDARGRAPGRLLERWQRNHETPAGIAALGAEVRDAAQGGYLTPQTPAAQARFLEDGLRELGALRSPPPVLFVHRWRGLTHGLHAPDGTPRPAAQVVAGFYTGRQTVFAIDAGSPPPAPPGATSFMIIGWGVALLLIGLLSSAPRFRDLIPSYFSRHNHYRESVQRSSTLEGLAGFGGMLVTAIAAGIILGVLLHALARTDALAIALSGLPEAQLVAAIEALQQPVLTAAIGAAAYLLWLLVNVVWLRVLAGRRYRVRPLQAAILTVLSRWQVLVLAVLALLAAQSDNTLAWLPWLLGAWVLFELYALVRMLYDYGKVTRVPMARAIVLGFGTPVVIGAVVVVLIIVALGPQLNFLWHLATRT